MITNSLDKDIHELISVCSLLGLPEKDCTDAHSYLEYNERGLALDTILTHMYEYDILIDIALYHQIEAIAKRMSVPARNYAFIAELIRPAQ